VLAALDAAFRESDLPIKVDVIDWRRIAPDLRHAIAADLVRFHLHDALVCHEFSANHHADAANHFLRHAHLGKPLDPHRRRRDEPKDHRQRMGHGPEADDCSFAAP
jgi:hypothetical protein